MTKKARPNGHIWMHAEQFYGAAEILWEAEGADLNKLALPLIVNYALAAELAMKSAEGITLYGQSSNGLIGAATLKSSAHGHDLVAVFGKLKATTRAGIEQEFQAATGEQLQPLLAKCADYFVQARYAYELKIGSYDLSGIRTLAGGLLKAVRAHGLKHPNGA